METELSQGLTFLAWTSGVFLIIIGIFTVKLLFDLSRLTLSIKKSTDIIHTELSPIMKNLNETTTTINDLVQTTNKKVGKFAEVCDKATDIATSIVAKASSAIGVVLKEGGKLIFSAIKSMGKRK